MAGWIKIRKNLFDEPEVWALSNKLNEERKLVFADLILFWCWCDEHLSTQECFKMKQNQDDPHIPKFVNLDKIVGKKGFSQALCEVGWLVDEGDWWVVPKYDKHLSKTAKDRSLESKRISEKRKIVSGKCPDEIQQKAEQTRLDQTSTRISDESKDSSSSFGKPKDAINWTEVAEWWNEKIAQQIPAPQIRFLSDRRKKGYRQRLIEHPVDLLVEIEESISVLDDFARKGWLNFDWIFLSQNNLCKLLEGVYDNERLRRDLSNQEAKRQSKENLEEYMRNLAESKQAENQAVGTKRCILHNAGNGDQVEDNNLGT
jgi:hypothetical protein